MIIDKETNKVYFSFQSTYDYKDELKSIKNILKKYNMNYGFISGTKDYFCRDYMPVQVDEKHFIQFQFYPDYLLQPDRLEYLTKIKQVHKKNKFLHNFNITFSNIILDGGNIIKWKDKVIITDKLFTENKNIQKSKIIDDLEKFLECKTIIIPAYPDEETGHADGLVRFIDDKTVLTYNLNIENNNWKNDLINILEDNDLRIKMLPDVSPEEDDNNWVYLNYLQIKDLIILPIFNRKSDEIMIKFFKETFKTNIETIYSQNILNQGGVLNCFTWNIKED